jgi:hypothetical protein
MGEGIRYVLNLQDALQRFLDDPNIRSTTVPADDSACASH